MVSDDESARRESVRTSAPIIIAAIDFAVSCFGSQESTTLPARRIVARSHSALISSSLWLM